MKICHVCAVDFTLEKLLRPLIDAQAAAGFEVTAICSEGQYSSDLRAKGYQIINVPIRRDLSPIHSFRVVLELVKVFKQHDFDVVHVHTHVAAFLGRIAAKIAGVSLIIHTAHGFYFHDGMSPAKRALYVFAEQLMRPFTDLLFTQSAEDAEDARVLRIMPGGRVFCIGNGVDMSIFDPDIDAKEALPGIPRDQLVVVMVSRLVKEKGVIEFLEAAANVTANRDDVTFVLVGERLSSDYAEEVTDHLDSSRLALGDALVLTGLRDDIPEILARADVFCLPSWREGMPRSIIEAMMMGVPVVATNIRGCREEVLDGDTGFLVGVRDVAALSEKLGKLVDDPILRKTMGSAGRLRATGLYNEQIVINRQLDLIQRFWVQE